MLEIPGSAPLSLPQTKPMWASSAQAVALDELQPVGIGTGVADHHSGSTSTPYGCLRVLPGTALVFDPVQLGKSSSHDAVVENCGTTALVVEDSVFVGGPPVAIDGLTVGTSLAPGAVRMVTLRAWPTSTGPWTATWWLRAGPVPPIAVQLSGQGHLVCLLTELAAPMQVLPGSEVAIDVAATKSPSGAKVTAQWTIAPPGDLVAAPVLADAVAAHFVASIAGTWRVCADVRDGVGFVGCAQVCKDIDVVPSAGLHVELLWQMMNPPVVHDRAPDRSDLDLHLAMAPSDGLDRDCDGSPEPWFSSHWDTWDGTPNQPWGLVGTADDGVLVVENHHGAGPEVAEVAAPSGTADVPQTYTIAVHHWDSQGNGAAMARVRVFVEGLLVAELGPQRVDPLSLWTAARVRWPNALSGGDVDAVLPCLQIGEPCDGGMRWANQGDACIDRCVTPVQSPKTPAAVPGACASGLAPTGDDLTPEP